MNTLKLDTDSLGPWAISLKFFIIEAVLGKHSISWSSSVKSHHSWHYHKLCTTIALAHLTDRASLKTRGFVAGLVVTCLSAACRVPPCARDTRTWECRHQLDFPMFSEYVGVVFSNRDSLSVWRAPCSLGNSLDVWGFLWEPFGWQLY